MIDEALLKTKVTMAIGVLQGVLDELAGVEPIIHTPFGNYRRDPLTGKKIRVKLDADGQWIPVPEPEPEPEPEVEVVVWPAPDFSDFEFLGTESYAQYIRKHMKTCCDAKVGAAGLVAECKTYWAKRATFYDPIKEFIAKWPQYFPTNPFGTN